MLSVLASGTLAADPRERTSAAGKIFCTGLLRCPVEDGEPILASFIAFAESTVEALLALKKGDAISIAGRAKLSEWEKDGETKHGISIVADRVLTAYAAGRARKQTAEAMA